MQPSAQKWVVASNAFYLTGIYRCVQVGAPGQRGPGDTIQIWDASSDVIVLADLPQDAQNLFENALRVQPEGQNSREITIRKVSLAPVVDRLLTESGIIPLNWPRIFEKSNALLESTPVDDFEQGYWVDVDSVVGPDKLSFSIGTLQSDVPEEVRSGLNWSGDKQFYFLLQVLPSSLPPPAPSYESETQDPEGDGSDEPSQAEIEAMNVTLPETAAVIRARNSIAAAWLWRRYAANTTWAGRSIRIAPMCGTLGDAR